MEDLIDTTIDLIDGLKDSIHAILVIAERANRLAGSVTYTAIIRRAHHAKSLLNVVERSLADTSLFKTPALGASSKMEDVTLETSDQLDSSLAYEALE